MKKKSRRLPRFKNDAEFSKFVDTHDMSSFFRDMDPADQTLTLAPELAEKIRERARKRLIALRLPQWQIDGARELARRKNVPYQALMRGWIGEGLRHELKTMVQAAR